MGLNKPLLAQYRDYLFSLARLDLGETITTRLPVASLLARAIPITMTIAAPTILLTVMLAIPLGTMAAFMAHRGKMWLDNLLTGLAMVLDLMPSFWTSLVFLLVFSLSFGWFPASGQVTWEDPWGMVARLALPVLVLLMTQVATMARITRTSVLEILSEDYVRTARSLGWSELAELFRHALKNAALPIATVIGLSFGNLLNGTMIVEFIFTIPRARPARELLRSTGMAAQTADFAPTRPARWRGIFKTAAGGDSLLANTKARIALAILVPILILTAVAPLLPIQAPLETNLFALMEPPSFAHPFGTDKMGRDIFSRTLSGIKVSLLVGFSVALIALAFGMVLGTLGGFFGGWTGP